ncbi:MAG: cysteine--tRNA ligase [Nitrososphaerota archaeon]|jgi:cysteinyl-tRNA synthetase|nr:cysteine--tRNA ligase [Nitrososphaerota archaeon]MDG6927714.1 cysteine--tRNA ligase [Nitrososphaerota archaeon]MDG6930181.1 cysteine--tRNA ligase [Nitrososphaerota archaeon]MDG6932054.1 cysteine--tRNA ligase [Nitrososphaerota archaeon]MDG6935429.1 cysteine--tRNA ligase [Nitrososphaerota archaeon]
MGNVSIYDTYTRSEIELDPARQKNITIYSCGVTVYDLSHIGHARVFIIFDILRRVLKKNGFNVIYAQNFTDMDDKIINRAANEGVDYTQISKKYIDEYFTDSDLLNISRADMYPRATDHIYEMVKIIKRLLETGYAYKTSDGIYFSVDKFPGYGRLSGIKKEELLAGARIDVNEDKKNPLDFALWKFHEDRPFFDTEIGHGRPGWHIECSAMIWKNLGDTITIHGGGEDLIFPHHENEIAQSEAFTGKPLSKIWMHIGLVKTGEEKMSKSLRNVFYIRDFLNAYGPNVLRVLMVQAHYRSQITANEDRILKAIEIWKIIEEAMFNLGKPFSLNGTEQSAVDEVMKELRLADNALGHDLDTPESLTHLLAAARAINRMQASLKLSPPVVQSMNLFNEITSCFGFKLPEISRDEAETAKRLVTERATLRSGRKYAEADQIRKKLLEMKIKLIDVGDKTYWRKVEVL